MSQGKDNCRGIRKQQLAVDVKKHPPKLMELDEETVAVARAKLAGLDFENLFGDEDRSSPELMIKTLAKKIRELFQTPAELKDAFSSDRKIAQARKDMMIDGIDLELVKDFCRKKQLRYSSDVDALFIIGFEQTRSGEANV